MDTNNHPDARRMLADVGEFHDHMGFHPYAKEAPPIDKVNEKRIKMLTEEVKELAKEVESGDKAKILHETVDVLYVALGALVEAGITGAELSVAWALVHQANMTKKPPSDPLGKGIKGKDFKPADCSLALGAQGEDRRYAVIVGGKISFASTIGPMTRDDFVRVCMDGHEKTSELPTLIMELSA